VAGLVPATPRNQCLLEREKGPKAALSGRRADPLKDVTRSECFSTKAPNLSAGLQISALCRRSRRGVVQPMASRV